MVDLQEEPQARVVVVGEAVDENEALFIGTLDEAKGFVLQLPAQQRAEVAIVTDGRIFDPREL